MTKTIWLIIACFFVGAVAIITSYIVVPFGSMKGGDGLCSDAFWLRYLIMAPFIFPFLFLHDAIGKSRQKKGENNGPRIRG